MPNEFPADFKEAKLGHPRMLPVTLQRLITGIVLIPVVVGLVWWGPLGLVAAIAAAVMVLALREFFNLGDHLGLHAYRVWTYLCGIAIFLEQWLAGESRSWMIIGGLRVTRVAPAFDLPLDLILFIFVLGVAGIIFTSRRPLADAMGDIGVSASGLLFVALPLSAVVRLHGIPVIGPKLLLLTLVLVWAGDTLAYFVGRSMGRILMAPQLSPKKTWEGAAANLLASLMVGFVFAFWLPLETWQVMVMAGLANIAGQAGDLLKSSYKRGAGVKDSGSLLPGHGGMLDRIDALILAAPVVWYYFQWVLASRA
jgi:phosphatidate cytidylyltransferase